MFRFPRRRIALPGFRRELAVLPQVAERVSLPVPVPTMVSHDDDPVEPWPFTGARLVPGRELAETALAGERRAAAAVGRFLRELHAPGRVRWSVWICPWTPCNAHRRALVWTRRVGSTVILCRKERGGPIRASNGCSTRLRTWMHQWGNRLWFTETFTCGMSCSTPRASSKASSIGAMHVWRTPPWTSPLLTAPSRAERGRRSSPGTGRLTLSGGCERGLWQSD